MPETSRMMEDKMAQEKKKDPKKDQSIDKPKKKDPHAGHRSRMRDRYMKTGLNGFQPHEILEMLLYYAIPRKDTNQIAHELLDQFGALDRVFAADAYQLKRIPNMTENAVVLIRLLRDLYHYQIIDEQLHIPLNSGKLAGEFFVKLYQYENHERIRVAFLDDRLCLLHCVQLGEGHPNASSISVRQLTEAAIMFSSNIMILAHNHPNGLPVASRDDIVATRSLVSTLQHSGIQLIDHIVVGSGQYSSLLECGAFLGL